LTHFVEVFGQGLGVSQHNKNCTCYERDSNPRSQCLYSRRPYTPMWL